MSGDDAINVLFLCTGNSARSVLCEAYLNMKSHGRFRAFSAGSHPSGAVNPFTLNTLEEAAIETEGLRSKSWDEFAAPGAPEMDVVITVCNQAAGEMCPIWPGHPATGHWGFPDPAAFEGDDSEKAAYFRKIFRQIRTRLDEFVALPVESLSSAELRKELDDIGRE
jgi:arsenate reductase